MNLEEGKKYIEKRFLDWKASLEKNDQKRLGDPFWEMLDHGVMFSIPWRDTYSYGTFEVKGHLNFSFFDSRNGDGKYYCIASVISSDWEKFEKKYSFFSEIDYDYQDCESFPSLDLIFEDAVCSLKPLICSKENKRALKILKELRKHGSTALLDNVCQHFADDQTNYGSCDCKNFRKIIFSKDGEYYDGTEEILKMKKGSNHIIGFIVCVECISLEEVKATSKKVI